MPHDLLTKRARLPYKQAAPKPTQSACEGRLLFDFNEGCRVRAAEGEPEWKIQFFDAETRTLVYATTLAGGKEARTSKAHFVRWRITAECEADGTSFEHEFDAADKPVLIHLAHGTLGDSLAWFPYAEKFRQRWGCRLSVQLAAVIAELVAPCYPEIEFLTHDDDVDPTRFYATYKIGLFWADEAEYYQPADFRIVGLAPTAGHILGVDPTPEPALIDGLEQTRPIPSRYCVIAVQSTGQAKYWNNPTGWIETVDWIKTKLGIEVVCIDRHRVVGRKLTWNAIPHGARDETGDRPLKERVRWLAHAEFFIGLSSGLAWLAWAAGTPVIMVSGFTLPLNEFPHEGRVFNGHVCNGCWHDIRHPFDHQDYFFCPRHKDTDRQYECTRAITAAHVIEKICQLRGRDPEPWPALVGVEDEPAELQRRVEAVSRSIPRAVIAENEQRGFAEAPLQDVGMIASNPILSDKNATRIPSLPVKSRKLHLGCGPHHLAGWVNADADERWLRARTADHNFEFAHFDATERFPYGSGVFEVIFSEHMIEHLTLDEGRVCLRECFRTLAQGGRLRIACPDIRKITTLAGDVLTGVQVDYIRWSMKQYGLGEPDDPGAAALVVNNFFRAWGHKNLLSAEGLKFELEKAGFVYVRPVAISKSSHDDLCDLEFIERMPPGFLELETMVFEAMKPI